jgi:magnesium-transporting ATPase (P-type)
MSEATAVDANGGTLRVVKGAFAAVIKLTEPAPTAAATAHELEEKGFRVLAVAVGTPATMRLAGIIALSDPPRTDAAELIKELHTLGVRTVMVTGDAPATAAIIARAVGLDGAICPPGPIPENVRPETSRSLPESFPRTSITSFRRSRRAATPSACAATAPMTRPRCARRRWELRFRLRRTSPSRRLESC